MRVALRPNPNRGPVAKPDVIKAPTKGWSANSLPIQAEEGTAIVLENFFPEATSLRPRKGFTQVTTGITGGCETLMGFVSGATAKLFAAGNAAIYDVTSTGALGAAVQSSLTSNKWSYVNFATAGGQFLFMVNGADAPRYYNGSAWTQPAITGVTAADLCVVTSHKSRLWFVEKNSTTLWYLAVDSVAGAATAFEVGSQFKKGGKVTAVSTWSVDAGNGMDDLLAIWSSEGEVLVYAGSTPGVDYAIVGHYVSGRPIGDRPLFSIGGDLAMISEDGILALSSVMRYDRLTAAEKSLSARIVDEFRSVARDYSSSFGWQLIALPKASMALVNVPGAGNAGDSVQFAYNVTTKAWSKFTGLDAQCWELFQGNIYFGTAAGGVYRAENGGSDNGSAITARCLPAFSHMGAPGRTKHVKMLQPLLSTDLSEYTMGTACVTNFSGVPSVGGGSPGAAGVFIWDTSVWDGPHVWGGTAVWDAWESASNIGYVISPYTEVIIDADSYPTFSFGLIGWNILAEIGGLSFTS